MSPDLKLVRENTSQGRFCKKNRPAPGQAGIRTAQTVSMAEMSFSEKIQPLLKKVFQNR